MRYLICFLASFTFVFDVTAAEINSYGKTIVIVRGEIKKGDLGSLKTVIRSEGYPIKILLDSQGGDVVEAMKLGKFFRQTLMSVSTVGRCESACFIAWAGGYERDSEVPIGLHRPYFDQAYFSKLSLENATKEYDERIKVVRDYLAEMDIPISLVEKMMSIDSTNAFYMDVNILNRSVGRYAPSMREWMISKCGTLTEAEMRDNSFRLTVRMHKDARQSGVDVASMPNLFDIKEYKTAKHAVSGMSPGYLAYLEEKSLTTNKCTAETIRNARSTIPL